MSDTDAARREEQVLAHPSVVRFRDEHARRGVLVN